MNKPEVVSEDSCELLSVVLVLLHQLLRVVVEVLDHRDNLSFQLICVFCYLTFEVLLLVQVHQLSFGFFDLFVNADLSLFHQTNSEAVDALIVGCQEIDFFF